MKQRIFFTSIMLISLNSTIISTLMAGLVFPRRHMIYTFASEAERTQTAQALPQQSDSSINNPATVPTDGPTMATRVAYLESQLNISDGQQREKTHNVNKEIQGLQSQISQLQKKQEKAESCGKLCC